MPRPDALRKLQSKHKLAATLHLKGERAVDIAQQLGVSVHAVHYWLQSPIFQEELERQREEYSRQASNALRVKAHQAALYLGSAVTPSDPDYRNVNGVGVRAACAILDRIGLSAFQPRKPEGEEEELDDIRDVEELRRVLGSLPKAVRLELIQGDEEAA